MCENKDLKEMKFLCKTSFLKTLMVPVIMFLLEVGTFEGKWVGLCRDIIKTNFSQSWPLHLKCTSGLKNGTPVLENAPFSKKCICTRGVFRTQLNIYNGAFFENS